MAGLEIGPRLPEYIYTRCSTAELPSLGYLSRLSLFLTDCTSDTPRQYFSFFLFDFAFIFCNIHMVKDTVPPNRLWTKGRLGYTTNG